MKDDNGGPKLLTREFLKHCYTYDTFNNENVKGNNFNLF